MKKLVSILLIAVILILINIIPVYASSEQVTQWKYYDKFLEYYGESAVYDEPAIKASYKEIYYHYPEDTVDEPEWALVFCGINPQPIEWKCGTLVGERILSVVGGCCEGFVDGYGVYVKKLDTFIELRQNSLQQICELCPDFVDAIEENEIGQQFGDVDDNGVLSVVDATYIQRVLANIYDFTYYVVLLDGSNSEISVCDFDRDGKTTVMDATAIQRKLAGLDTEPEYNEEIVIVTHPQEIESMPWNAVPLPFDEEYGEEQVYSHIYLGNNMMGTVDTFAIVKSNEQYNSLFNEDAPVFEDEFFESKWLVVFCVEMDGRGGFIHPVNIAKLGDTLYSQADVFVSASTTPPPPIMRWWVSMLAVDKDDIANVTDIVRVE